VNRRKRHIAVDVTGLLRAVVVTAASTQDRGHVIIGCAHRPAPYAKEGGRLWRMAFLRVDARPLLPRLRAELVALLATLSRDDWGRVTACPGWPVHAVAAHLLGVELGNVSVRRDRWQLSPGTGEDPDAWLNSFNQQWVDAARRISPALLIELLDHAGRRFEEHAALLDPDADGGPVEWATGHDPAPVWLDIAREYMERYVHQHQIRDAVRRPPLGAALTAPVLTTAAHALPRALRPVTCPAGTVVTFTADGEGGGTWHLVQAHSGWELQSAQPPRPAACHARTTVAGAIKLYTQDPSAPPLTWHGDPQLAHALSHVKAVLG
jgi:uncharacterized protein (TIGR03083 family)